MRYRQRHHRSLWLRSLQNRSLWLEDLWRRSLPLRRAFEPLMTCGEYVLLFSTERFNQCQRLPLSLHWQHRHMRGDLFDDIQFHNVISLLVGLFYESRTQKSSILPLFDFRLDWIPL